MITANTREYSFYKYGSLNAYGQPQLSSSPAGTIKMSIYLTNQALSKNALYATATYIGLTTDVVDDTYVVDFGGILLKVGYVSTDGRYKQVYMEKLT